jgi:hypothetical protein
VNFYGQRFDAIRQRAHATSGLERELVARTEWSLMTLFVSPLDGDFAVKM